MTSEQRRFSTFSLFTTEDPRNNIQFVASLLNPPHPVLFSDAGDWQWERGSAVYLLGDVINIEAAVFAPQMSLRVFVDRCVATSTPNVESSPRYDFVDNNG